jgi:hypothetical protein
VITLDRILVEIVQLHTIQIGLQTCTANVGFWRMVMEMEELDFLLTRDHIISAARRRWRRTRRKVGDTGRNIRCTASHVATLTV